MQLLLLLVHLDKTCSVLWHLSDAPQAKQSRGVFLKIHSGIESNEVKKGLLEHCERRLLLGRIKLDWIGLDRIEHQRYGRAMT